MFLIPAPARAFPPLFASAVNPLRGNIYRATGEKSCAKIKTGSILFHIIRGGAHPLKKKVLLLLCAVLVVSLFPPVSAAADASAPEVPSVIEVVKSVNFRKGPSTSKARIRFLKAGERLDVLGRPNTYWYEAKDKNGVIGYVSTSSTYVKTVETEKLPEPNGLIKKSVNFRTKPSTSGNRIRFLQKGEYVWILEKVNAYWYKAKDAYGEVGYVSTSSKYIESMFETETEPEEETFFDEPNGKVVRSVNFRKKPSTAGERIRYLKAGEPIWVLGRYNSYWYQIMDKNGVTGFVSTSAKYVETTYQEPWKSLSPSDIAEQAIAVGLTYLGTPYEFGSSRYDTTTFDCSDFVRHTFLSSVQLALPGDSRKQAEFVRNLHDDRVVTDWRNLKRGDLMFFMGYKGYKASAYAGIDRMNETVRHVGIYLGDGQVLHTYSVNSGGVRIDKITGSQWELRFLYGGSPVR